jgi:hypothetical protein
MEAGQCICADAVGLEGRHVRRGALAHHDRRHSDIRWTSHISATSFCTAHLFQLLGQGCHCLPVSSCKVRRRPGELAFRPFCSHVRDINSAAKAKPYQDCQALATRPGHDTWQIGTSPGGCGSLTMMILLHNLMEHGIIPRLSSWSSPHGEFTNGPR